MALTARAQKLRDRMVTTPGDLRGTAALYDGVLPADGGRDRPPDAAGPKALAYTSPYDRPHRRRRAFCGKLYQ